MQAEPVIVQAKASWLSKTAIFNALAIAVALLSYAAGLPELADHAPLILAIVGAVNVVLRFGTDRPVTLTGGEMVEVQRLNHGPRA
jgi:hypothetical protein